MLVKVDVNKLYLESNFVADTLEAAHATVSGPEAGVRQGVFVYGKLISTL